MKKRRVETYEELYDLYKSGVDEVFVEYDITQWNLDEDSLVSEMHTMKEKIYEYDDDKVVLDLQDSNLTWIGELERSMEDESIRVYLVEGY